MGLREAGERLRELRKAARLNQADAGKLVGAASKTVERWERGLSMPEDMVRFRRYLVPTGLQWAAQQQQLVVHQHRGRAITLLPHS